MTTAGRRWAGSDDRGTSLIELVVGMSLMVIFMAIFTSSVVMMNRSVTKTESVNRSSLQLTQAYLTLDRSVRYAAAISPPGRTVAGGWYVELRTTNTGVENCTQLRVNTALKRLERRTWRVGPSSSVVGLTTWTQLADGITNGGVAPGTTQPFQLLPQSSTVAYQQLLIRLVAAAGSGTTATSSESTIEFTAVNSIVPPPAAAICAEAGRP